MRPEKKVILLNLLNDLKGYLEVRMDLEGWCKLVIELISYSAGKQSFN